MAVLLGYAADADLVTDTGGGNHNGPMHYNGEASTAGYLEGYAAGLAVGIGVYAQLAYNSGLEDGSMLTVAHATAKTVSVRTISATTGLPITLAGGDLTAAVVALKKAGGAFATITPTKTARGTFVDLDLTIAHTDTLGILDLTFIAAGCVPATVRMDVALPHGMLDALLADHAVVGSVADGIAIAGALLQGNYVMDQTVTTNPNGQTAARLRCFRTGVAAAAATDGGAGEGEFATFVVTTTYTGPGKIKFHQVVRQ